MLKICICFLQVQAYSEGLQVLHYGLTEKSTSAGLDVTRTKKNCSVEGIETF